VPKGRIHDVIDNTAATPVDPFKEVRHLATCADQVEAAIVSRANHEIRRVEHGKCIEEMRRGKRRQIRSDQHDGFSAARE
jgi:hypothetical protein